jgi:hypothetical protein
MKTDTIIKTETATVYKSIGRRFLTKKAAYRAHVRFLILKRCDCYNSSDYDEPPEVCRYHSDLNHYSAIIDRGARMFEAHDKRLARQSANH